MPTATAETETKSEQGGVATKKMPSGVVLGKDGKPCRSCTSFAAWAAQAKEQQRHPRGDGGGSSSSSSSSSSDYTHGGAGISTAAGPQPDCPPDVDALGRSSWTLLHSMAAAYPETPTAAQQADLAGFVGLFARLYPCWVCAEDFQAYMARRAPRVASRAVFAAWLCAAHNDVNRKLGKPLFDCSRWDERWRSGWRDGRCD